MLCRPLDASQFKTFIDRRVHLVSFDVQTHVIIESDLNNVARQRIFTDKGCFPVMRFFYVRVLNTSQ